jgi:hypothetical protein
MLAAVRARARPFAETCRLRRLRRARVNGNERERTPSAAIAAIVTIGTMSSADGTARRRYVAGRVGRKGLRLCWGIVWS